LSHQPAFHKRVLVRLRQLRHVGSDPPPIITFDLVARRNIHANPPGLVAREQLGRRAPPRLILEIDISQFSDRRCPSR
jgi:hypothetical protein